MSTVKAVKPIKPVKAWAVVQKSAPDLSTLHIHDTRRMAKASVRIMSRNRGIEFAVIRISITPVSQPRKAKRK